MLYLLKYLFIYVRTRLCSMIVLLPRSFALVTIGIRRVWKWTKFCTTSRRKWKISPSFTWWTSPKCRISIKCKWFSCTPIFLDTLQWSMTVFSGTNCTIRVRLCFSSATSTSWSIWALETTTKLIGLLKTNRKWSISWRPCIEVPGKDAVWSYPLKTIQLNTVIKLYDFSMTLRYYYSACTMFINMFF